MTDIQHRLYQDYGERTTTFEVVQDVQPYLDRNAMLRSQPQKSDWGKHIASVPNVIVNRWLQEAWNAGNTSLQFGSEEWRQLVWKKLQDPDYKFLRVD